MRDKKLSTISIIIIWTVIIALVPIISNIIEEKSIEKNVSYISSNLDIKDYDVILDVDKNNKIDVTENITVNIPENAEYKGIYRSFPLWIRYYDDNLKEKKCKVEISNLRAIGQQFVVEEFLDRVGLQVGSKRVNADSGLHTYTIKYRYDFGMDVNNQLIFNIFENYNKTKIENMTVNINLPEDAKDYDINFLKRTEGLEDNVIYKKEGNKITATLNDYLLDDAVTLKITFPDGYLIGGTSNYGIVCMTACIVIIIISFVAFVLWTKYGRDYKKRVSTVEFYPPDDLDAAEIGYVYAGEIMISKLTAALIIQLANKGYIKIEEIEKLKYKIIDIGKGNKELKNLSVNEQIVYLELFRNGSENILSEDKMFGKVFGKLSKSLKTIFSKKIKDDKANKIMKYTFILLTISIILWSLSYIFIKDLNPVFDVLYLISFVSILVTGIFTIIMDRKTEYGEMITARVKGFRNYLSIARKDDLETIVEKNPNYFYDIIPYTYVMDVSNRWVKEFNSRNLPDVGTELLRDFGEDIYFFNISEE